MLSQARQVAVVLGRASRGCMKPCNVIPPMCVAHRNFNRKKTVKMPPTKPINFSHSGDLTTALDSIDLTQPVPLVERVKELEDAPEEVKRLFSLEFADSSMVLEKRIQEIRSQIQEHPADVASLEVKIAEMTVKIRNGMRHTLEFRKDKLNKSRLFGGITSRMRMLGELKLLDYDKFLWLCERLQLQYIPEDPYKHIRLGKRAMRKKIARDAALKMCKDKLADLRQQLEKEKVVFLEAKEKEMRQLEEEMRQLGVEDFTDMDTVLKQLLGPEYQPPVKQTVSRRNLILQKKFQLYTKLKQTPT